MHPAQALSTFPASGVAEQVRSMVGFIGLLVQLVGSMLLVVLFFLLRRNTSRSTYFSLWAWAWFCVMVGIAVLALGSRVVAAAWPHAPGNSPAAVQVVHVVYQLAKLASFVCLAVGTGVYATGLDVRRYVPALAAGAVAYALISVRLTVRGAGMMAWQAPVAIAALAYGAYRLLALAPSRRTLGSEVTGTVFGLAAALWSLYAVSFVAAALANARVAASTFGSVVRYNAYLDMAVELLLGFGMVVMLLEDAKRAVDDAHAELAVAHDHLKRAALLDPLTGALNRRAFAEGVGLEAAKAAFGTVAMFDVDNLKMVNDTYGHGAGDAVLKALVDALRSAFRPSDRIYRWGGDEFLVVLPGARAADAQSKLEALLAAAPPAVPRGVGEGLTLLASIGVADYTGAEELAFAIEAADRAMYDAKRRRKSSNSAPRPAA